MKYKCLVLDHDDTVVRSTATIHYPCFIEYLKIYRPHLVKNYTVESYFEKNFHPGVESLFLDEVGLTEEEFLSEQRFWSDYVKGHVPEAYSGIGDILRRFISLGGIVAVVSHSYEKYIIRDYEENGLPKPQVIYSWDMPPERRKPSPFALLDLMERYSLSPRELLVVDDLKPGYDMARAAGVDFAAAGWAYDVPAIKDFMRKSCDFYLERVEDLSEILFEG